MGTDPLLARPAPVEGVAGPGSTGVRLPLAESAASSSVPAADGGQAAAASGSASGEGRKDGAPGAVGPGLADVVGGAASAPTDGPAPTGDATVAMAPERTEAAAGQLPRVGLATPSGVPTTSSDPTAKAGASTDPVTDKLVDPAPRPGAPTANLPSTTAATAPGDAAAHATSAGPAARPGKPTGNLPGTTAATAPGGSAPHATPTTSAGPAARAGTPAGAPTGNLLGAPAATASRGSARHAAPATSAAQPGAWTGSPSGNLPGTPGATASGGSARHAAPTTAADPASKPGTPAASATTPNASAGQVGELRRIIGAPFGVIAVPVAAEAKAQASTQASRPAGRRRTVIGTETTGSIPVHLLFRDQPEPDDDGGPATIAMAPPVAAKAVIPAPTRPEPSRPAPTADPQLVERPGSVLPGWIGVVGGVLALAGCAAIVWWVGAVPEEAARMLRLPPRPYYGIHLGQWALLALGVLATLFAFGGLGRGRVGYAWVLTLFGDYRGSVRRTGLLWVSPLLLRRRVDIRLRHWRSEPLPSVDAKGTALDVVVLVVWRVRDTVRAALGVDGHEEYLREQVEAVMARVLSQLPADAFHEDAPTLRDAEAVGEALTRMLSAECAPVGIDVFSAQPTRIEYAPEIAAAMQRRRIAAIDAKHRDSVLTSVVDAVDDVVHRLTTRGLVELDDYERKALVKDLTVAFYTGRTGPVEGA